MTSLLAGGLLMVLVATGYLIDIVRRKGPKFEYALASFLAEAGLMFVSGQVFPTVEARVAATTLFGVGALASAATMFVLIRRHNREQRSQPRASVHDRP
jgi:hypothetical protein